MTIISSKCIRDSNKNKWIYTNVNMFTWYVECSSETTTKKAYKNWMPLWIRRWHHTLYPMHAGQNNPIKLAAAATQLHYVTAQTYNVYDRRNDYSMWSLPLTAVLSSSPSFSPFPFSFFTVAHSLCIHFNDSPKLIFLDIHLSVRPVVRQRTQITMVWHFFRRDGIPAGLSTSLVIALLRVLHDRRERACVRTRSEGERGKSRRDIIVKLINNTSLSHHWVCVR